MYSKRRKKSKAMKESEKKMKGYKHIVNEALNKQRELAKEDEERRAKQAQEDRARKKREKYGHTDDYISKI